MDIANIEPTFARRHVLHEIQQSTKRKLIKSVDVDFVLLYLIRIICIQQLHVARFYLHTPVLSEL